MTKQEKIILSAYTGILMCEFDDLHKYIEEVLERPVFTHELASEDVMKEIREACKTDFMKIIREDSNESVINPSQFYERMLDLKSMNCEEERHIEMDDLMCKTLVDLGYEAGVGVFESTGKWYA